MKDRKPFVIGLKGGQKFQRLLAGDPETSGMKSGHVILGSGESVGEHKTEAKEEAIIILEGRAEVFVDGKLFAEVKAGELIYMPLQTVHDIKNSADQPLRYVYVVAPVRTY